MRVGDSVDQTWADGLPLLEEFLRIPSLSPAFDAEWAQHRHIDRAAQLFEAWAAGRNIEGATVELRQLPGHTPVLLVDVPTFGNGRDDETVLLYGHLDKQPEMVGWRDGIEPFAPTLEGDRLYGRGGADDGYALVAALGGIEAVRASGGSHARCLVLIEASEESGSPDLPAHLEGLGDRLDTVSLVIGLDSWCGTYDRLWTTTSLRGVMNLTVRVDVLREGLHSGAGGGVVPSSFLVLRELLDRIEDAKTGRVLLPELQVDIPAPRIEQARAAAPLLDPNLDIPWVEGVTPLQPTTAEALVARDWSPSIAYIGASGLPSPGAAGNVLRPSTELVLAVRLPPTCDARAARAALTERLTTNPPHGAKVTVTYQGAEGGWEAPPESPWLLEALEQASLAHFGQPAVAMGSGGTIPFMGMLGSRCPDAEFVITGVLGPESNAHGPNEFLHLPTARRITAVTASLLDAHASRQIVQ